MGRVALVVGGMRWTIVYGLAGLRANAVRHIANADSSTLCQPRNEGFVLYRSDGTRPFPSGRTAAQIVAEVKPICHTCLARLR